MTLFELLNNTYEVSKYTIHLTRGINYNGLHYERFDMFNDVDSISYQDKSEATVAMFSCKAKGHIEIWAYLNKEATNA